MAFGTYPRRPGQPFVTNGAVVWCERQRIARHRRYTGAMNLIRTTLLGLALAVPALCFGQWQWVDKDGRKVFSDQAPPADVPTRNILRQPGQKGRSVPVEAAAPASATSQPVQPAQPTAAAPKLTGKDKELQEKKRRAEAAEAEKKKAEEEQIAKLRAENCERARRSKAGFDSGVRIAQTNAKGEREILDDAQRAAEVKRLERIIASECRPAQ